jgi:hypothetical protein
VPPSWKNPAQELGRLYTSRALHEAYLAQHPHLGDIKNVSAALRSQYPAKLDEISIDDMLLIVRRALERGRLAPDSSGARRPGPRLPCTPDQRPGR